MATARLRSSWEAIAMACDGADAAATAEARLTAYHDAFHAVMEAAGGGHGHHGGEHHGGEHHGGEHHGEH
jgi:hypothetical protein